MFDCLLLAFVFVCCWLVGASRPPGVGCASCRRCGASTSVADERLPLLLTPYGQPACFHHHNQGLAKVAGGWRCWRCACFGSPSECRPAYDALPLQLYTVARAACGPACHSALPSPRERRVGRCVRERVPAWRLPKDGVQCQQRARHAYMQVATPASIVAMSRVAGKSAQDWDWDCAIVLDTETPLGALWRFRILGAFLDVAVMIADRHVRRQGSYSTKLPTIP